MSDYPTEGEKNVQGWRVQRIQVGRGHAKRANDDDAPLLPVVGLTLWCEDLDTPGEFMFAPEDAEATGRALLDSVEKFRRAQ